MNSFFESAENFDVLLFDNYGVITFGHGISKAVLKQMERLKERGREVTMANVVGLAYQDEGIVPDYICERVSDEEPLF